MSDHNEKISTAQRIVKWLSGLGFKEAATYIDKNVLEPLQQEAKQIKPNDE